MPEPDRAGQLAALIQADPCRWHALALVRDLCLPDCWIGAGFVRNAAWDRSHGRAVSAPDTDADVIWFDPARTDPGLDRSYEAALAAAAPGIAWSVKNQARMHARNADAPYTCSTDAMRHWPETATAVAVRRTRADACEIAAPCGLDDLFDLLLRPTPRFAAEKRAVFDGRVAGKGWLARWPGLRLAGTGGRDIAGTGGLDIAG
jgi:hypothetical protein